MTKFTSSHVHAGDFPRLQARPAVEPWEYEISEVIDLLIRRGQTIDAIGLKDWRVDVRYLEDQDEAGRLQRRIRRSSWKRQPIIIRLGFGYWSVSDVA